MDGTTITFIGLIVTAVGVVATLVAPRLVRSSRIEAEFESVDRISQQAPTGEMRVDVFHNDQKVDGSLFVARGIIANIGSKDITREHFVDPVEIGSRNESSIISLDVDAPAGVKPSVASFGDKWTIDWSILKPREQISITAVVVSTNDEVTSKSIDDNLWIIARLSDVSTGRGIFRGTNIWYGFLVFIITATVTAFFLVYEPSRPYKTLTLSVGGQDRIIMSAASGFSACSITERLALQKCKPIDEYVVISGLSRAEIKTVHRGIPGASVVLVIASSILYGFIVLVLTNRPVIRRLVRKTSRRLGRFRAV